MDFYKRRRIKRIIVKLSAFISLTIMLLVSLIFSRNIENFINNYNFDFNENILSSKTQVHYIDVGQGDCTVFILPDGKRAMIDTGASTSAERLIKYLDIIGLNKGSDIDYLILTHTDSDHIGNACLVMSNFNVKNIYIPKVYSRFELQNNLITNDYNINYTDLWYNTCLAINSEVDNNHKFYSYKDLVIENNEYGYSFIFYYPFEDKISESNNYSPIIVFNDNDKKFMFVGDIDSGVESEFISYYANFETIFDVDVLKVSHHGSKNSTTSEFLNFVKPEVAIISCGEDNLYFHPSNETINRLTSFGCDIFRTDTTSSIVCGIFNTEIFIQTGYDNISSFHFYWWYFVLSAVVVSFILLFCLKIKG